MSFNLKNRDATHAPWHPDFTNEETLPDVKLVRTEFVVNFFSVAILLGVAFFFGSKEWSSYQLRSQIKEVEQGISAKLASNKSIMRQDKEYGREIYTIAALQNFYKHSINPLEYIMLVSQNRPDAIVFDEVEFVEGKKAFGKAKKKSKKKGKKKAKEEVYYLLGLRGSIPGSYDYALGILNEYKSMLSSLDEIKPILEDIETVSLRRDPDLGLFTYDFHVILRPEKAAQTK